jgi:hypothetical protein
VQAAAVELASLSAPPDVVEALSRFCDELIAAAGDNLVALLIYGGLARRRYRPGRSDINLAILLNDAGAASLGRLAPILKAAWREIRLEPFILIPGEIPRAALSFPTKFLDMRSHHLLLYGQDLLNGVHVSKQNVCRRVEQDLRNLALRLRRRFVSAAGDRADMLGALSDIVVPLRINLLSMLELAGDPTPSDDRSALVFAAAARRFNLDGEALATLSDLRKDGGTVANIEKLYDVAMNTALRSADAVAAMGVDDEPA